MMKHTSQASVIFQGKISGSVMPRWATRDSKHGDMYGNIYESLFKNLKRWIIYVCESQGSTWPFSRH